MRRIVTLLVAVVVLGLSPAHAENFKVPVAYDSKGACQFMNNSCPTHLGADYMVNTYPRDVIAISHAYAAYYQSDASSFGGCNVKGGALWLKHRKADGSYFWALYGHIQNSIVTREKVVVSVDILSGSKVCEVANYYPCYGLDGNCIDTACPHLHFGIWDDPNFPCGPPDYRCSGWGYGSQGHFTDPNAFLVNEHPYPDNSTYTCQWSSQDPPGWSWVKPGDIHPYTLVYKNTGTATWENTGGVNNINYTELRSCNSGGVEVESWFDPVNWINRKRVVTCQESTVQPNHNATYTFQAQVPAGATTGDVPVYFRPYGGGGLMDNWGGATFWLHVDATPPNAPVPAVSPGSCTSSNNFTATWNVPTDVGIGTISGYYWKVNGYGETFTTGNSISIPAGQVQEGTNTFSVRAIDGVGNSSGAGSTTFCFTGTDNNLSFEKDLDLNNIPDGWNVVNLNGAGYVYGSGGAPDGTRFVEFTHTASNHWNAIGRPAAPLIIAGTTYRLSFWYRTSSAVQFSWRLGDGGLTSHSSNILGANVSNPLTDGQWHRFWGGVFSVSQSQLNYEPMLTMYFDYGTIGTVDIDWVSLIPSSQCP